MRSKADETLVIVEPLSPLLHFSRKSSFSFQVYLRMFLLVDLFNFWFDKSA